MKNDSSEIKALRRIVWRTAIAGRLERFAAVLDDPAKQRHFAEPFLDRLSAKLDRLFRLQVILAAVYLVLMLSLYAAQDPKKTEFQILGYSFKNLGYYKELLLFVAALLTPTSSVVAAYHRYLGEIRKVALQKLIPEKDVRDFSAHVYFDNFLDPLLSERTVPHRKPHGVTMLLVAVFGMTLMTLALAIVAASFVLQISVIYDVATNPSSTQFINHFIVAFSLGAIALSWMIGVLQLPLPEVDIEASMRLSKLQKQDPSKYQETMKRIAVESARRERTWFLSSGVLVFASIYSIVAALIPVPPGADLWKLFLVSVPGLALIIFLSTTVAGGIKGFFYSVYFRRYPEGTDRELKKFTWTTRLIGACRVSLLAAASLGYSVFMLGGK
jgi:hypothetical protein